MNYTRNLLKLSEGRALQKPSDIPDTYNLCPVGLQFDIPPHQRLFHIFSAGCGVPANRLQKHICGFLQSSQQWFVPHLQKLWTKKGQDLALWISYMECDDQPLDEITLFILSVMCRKQVTVILKRQTIVDHSNWTILGHKSHSAWIPGKRHFFLQLYHVCQGKSHYWGRQQVPLKMKTCPPAAVPAQTLLRVNTLQKQIQTVTHPWEQTQIQTLDLWRIQGNKSCIPQSHMNWQIWTLTEDKMPPAQKILAPIHLLFAKVLSKFTTTPCPREEGMCPGSVQNIHALVVEHILCHAIAWNNIRKRSMWFVPRFHVTMF